MSSISPLSSISFYTNVKGSSMNETAGSAAYRNKQSSSGETAGSAGYENPQASKNETAGSVGFRGNKAKYLENAAKNLKSNPLGKSVSPEEAKNMIVEASNEAFKRFKLEQLIKSSPAEAREVMMREIASKMPEAVKGKGLNIKI